MFNLTQYLIREQVGLLKIKDTYDILDPRTGQKIAVAKEIKPWWKQLLTMVLGNRIISTRIEITEEGQSKPSAILYRGFTFWRSKVLILNSEEQKVGHFLSKWISIGGGFNVFDANENQIAEVKGNWIGWNFKFLDKEGQELGNVSKKWESTLKELFTTADSYMVTIHAPKNALLLLMAGLAIDTVYKEKGGGLGSVGLGE